MTQTQTPRSQISVWVAGARPRTLPAAVVPVVVGTAAAANADFGNDGGIVAWRLAAALLVSLALQVAVNYANDYSDGIRGTDDDRVGPLRLVGSGLVPAKQVKVAALLAMGIAGISGLALAAAVGWELLIVGAAAIAAAWFYTGGPNPYGYLGLGELFVFVFFGLVATIGSAYVQVGAVDGIAVAASTSVGLVAVALLVTNNLRDIPGDTESGKRTLAVRLGDARTRVLYVGLIAVAIASAALLSIARGPWMLLVLLATIAAWKPIRTVNGGAKGQALIPVLATTGLVQLVLGATMAVGLWISS